MKSSALVSQVLLCRLWVRSASPIARVKLCLVSVDETPVPQPSGISALVHWGQSRSWLVVNVFLLLETVCTASEAITAKSLSGMMVFIMSSSLLRVVVLNL